MISVLSSDRSWIVTESAKILFLITEEKFRVETKNDTVQKINIFSLALALAKDINVQTSFKDILENCPAYDEGEHSEEAPNILEKHFIMHMRIRCFSLTKDLVVKVEAIKELVK